MTTDTLGMLLQQLIDGQVSIDRRLEILENTFAERRGERRVGLWLLTMASGFAGAIAAYAAHFIEALVKAAT